MTIFTIGYEGIELDAFLTLLSASGIETVVDIRELPLSRKRGFSKKALGNALHEAGFEYVHVAALGCPKVVRNRYREDGDWARYTKGFLLHLDTQEKAIADLTTMATESSCVLLCYEADFNVCHRSLVAEALRVYGGLAVEHLSAGIKTTRPVSRQRIPARVDRAGL